MKNDQHLSGRIVSIRHIAMTSHIPIDQAQRIDHLTETNRRLIQDNKPLIADSIAAWNNPVERIDAHAKEKSSTLKKIVEFLRVRESLE